MLTFLLTFFVAAGVTMALTPLVRDAAQKIGAIDQPSSRKIHTASVPRSGGLAIFVGFMAAIGFGLCLMIFSGRQPNFIPLSGILLGGTIVHLAGLWDDVRGMQPLFKLGWQVVGAGIAVYFGVEINFFSNPFNGLLPLGWFGVPLTIFWLVGMTNAINLLDGLDGLAAGVTAIAAGALFFVALRTHQLGAVLLMLALAGSALGFLRYNFNPASIFLGDSGSYFLGFILAAASVTGVFKTTLVVALLIPILILGVPIFDTTFAILRRIKERKNIFSADDRHIHHLLLRAGLTHREAVMSIYIASFILALSALIMALQK